MNTLRSLISLLQPYDTILSFVTGIITFISLISSLKSHRSIFIKTYRIYKEREIQRRHISTIEKIIDIEINILNHLSTTPASRKTAEILSRYLLKFKGRENKKSQNKSTKNKASSVVGLFAMDRSKNNMIASLCLISCLIVYCIVTYISGNYIINLVSIGLSVLITLVAIDEYVLAYRVKNGSFGYNSDEAREIITFIIKNSNNDNNKFNGHNGKKINIFDKQIEKSIDTEEGYNFGLNQFPA